MTSHLQICLDLVDLYREKLKNSLMNQGITEDKAEDIRRILEPNKDIIFSLNRPYKKAITLEQLCSQMGLNRQLPRMFKKKWRLYSHQVEAIESIYNGR